MGAIFVILAGAWIAVGQFLTPTSVQSVEIFPQESFDPTYPSMSLEPVKDDKNCPDFFDQDDAQKYYIAQGGPTRDPDMIDLDKDGFACENYPYSSTTISPETEGK